MRTASLLATLDIQECNGNYERLVIERIENLAKIKNCDVLELTLKELISCAEAASLDFNELCPVIWHGQLPRPEHDVRADFVVLQ